MKAEASGEQVASILNDYKVNTKADLASGQLVFGSLPIIYARAEIMASIYQELFNLVGESASSVLKRMGKSYGEKFHDLIEQEDSELFEDREMLFKFVCAETQAIGWGRIAIEDDGRTVTITSPEGLAGGRILAQKGKQPQAVDSYFLGYFEGFLTKLDGTAYESEESKCVAKGDAHCIMTFRRQANK